MYIALIGDIIHSKEISKSKRNEVQLKLRDTLDQINIDYSSNIAARFLITIGDEFQGLLMDPSNLLKIIDTIQYKLYPIKIRFGIGIGAIDTEINIEMALGADGPAYHFARKMVDSLKLLQKGKMSGSPNIMLYTDQSEKNSMIDLINSNLQLCTFIESKWTEKQRQLIHMIYMEEKNQMEAANRLGVAQSSVQRRLKSAGYYDYIGARDLVLKTLKEAIWGKRFE